MKDVVLILYKPVLDAQLKTPAGGLWRWLERRGRKALNDARKQVHVDTGRLKKSLHMRHAAKVYGQELWIGSNTVPYAYMHHEGTKPHMIAPKNGTVLRMRSGRIVHGPVMHPGTPPNKFLSSQLHHFRH